MNVGIGTHFWGHMRRVQGPSVPGVGKPSSDAGPHLFPLGRAEGTEDTFATALLPTKPRGKWGGAGAKSLLKGLSRKSMWFVAATGFALRDSDSKAWTRLQKEAGVDHSLNNLPVCQALCGVFPRHHPSHHPSQLRRQSWPCPVNRWAD